jgi:hypothetical protein
MPINVLEKCDLDLLKKQVKYVLDSNEVKEQRLWNNNLQDAVFHAPLLDTKPDRIINKTTFVKWIYELWWNITLPWKTFYPHQWFWDSCAHAIVLSHIDVDMAKKEIESLLYSQRSDGFIPHMIWNKSSMHWADRIMQVFYPSRDVSPYIQPPVLAEALMRILEKSRDIEFIINILPSVKKYYLYLDSERCRSSDGLLEIIMSYESGKDRSPEYDWVYGESNAKPLWHGPMFKLLVKHLIKGWNIEKIFTSNLFQVKDLLFNCIYAHNLKVLSDLCEAAGEEKDRLFFYERSLKVEHSILSKMYCEERGLFYSLDARYNKDEQIIINTVSTLMPLILNSITEPHVEKLVKDYLYSPSEFWTEYPLPVVPKSTAEEIEGHIIWRGLQTWIYPNWYIVRGLRKQANRFPEHHEEYNHIADELTSRTYELVQKEGFCDFYHSQTGKCGVGPRFSWSTLILDMVYDSLSDSDK